MTTESPFAKKLRSLTDGKIVALTPQQIDELLNEAADAIDQLCDEYAIWIDEYRKLERHLSKLNAARVPDAVKVGDGLESEWSSPQPVSTPDAAAYCDICKKWHEIKHR